MIERGWLRFSKSIQEPVGFVFSPRPAERRDWVRFIEATRSIPIPVGFVFPDRLPDRLGRAVGPFEERIRPQLDLLDRLEVIQDVFGVCAADLSMKVEGESVWALCVDQLGLEGQEGFNGIELAHHRRAEEVDPRPPVEQDLDDVSSAHVRGPAEPGLPVAVAPVHRRVEHRRFPIEQLFDHVEIRMRIDDEVLREQAIDLRLLPRRLEVGRGIVAIERGLDRLRALRLQLVVGLGRTGPEQNPGAEAGEEASRDRVGHGEILKAVGRADRLSTHLGASGRIRQAATVAAIGFRPVSWIKTRPGRGEHRRMSETNPNTADGEGDLELRSLLGRIRLGHEDAARELLERYEAQVRLVVRRQLPRILRSRFDSLDFLQSVWGSFFRQMRAGPEGFEEPRALVAFLAKVAKNKVIDEYRRAASKKADMALEEPIWSDGARPRELVSDEDSASEVVEAREAMSRLQDLLPDDRRVIVELRVQGLSTREIGEKLALSERTVRRALEDLRRRAEAAGEGEPR